MTSRPSTPVLIWISPGMCSLYFSLGQDVFTGIHCRYHFSGDLTWSGWLTWPRISPLVKFPFGLFPGVFYFYWDGRKLPGHLVGTWDVIESSSYLISFTAIEKQTFEFNLLDQSDKIILYKAEFYSTNKHLTYKSWSKIPQNLRVTAYTLFL